MIVLTGTGVGTRISWGVSIELEELPILLTRFRQRLPNTAEIEAQGRLLAQNQFDPSGTRAFIKSVCRWGGYSGVAGRVVKHNDPFLLTSAFKTAYAKLLSGDDELALETILQINGLAVSFATKHLKFLAPDRAVVLDSIIGARLGYALTKAGYLQFLADCRAILTSILQAHLPYTGWATDGWRVSDVEMAIFEKLRVQPKKR